MNNTALILIIGIIAAIVLFKFDDISESMGWNVSLNIGGTNNYVYTDQNGNPVNPDQGGVDICTSYTSNFPAYFAQRELDCASAGGNFVCKPTKAGCYDIVAWNHVTLCSSAEARGLQALCAGMGGSWSCNAIQIGCER